MKQNFTIRPETLSALPAFVRVARLGSFRMAADQLGVSASAVSQTLRGLESRLGVRLLNRTTRRVGLTEAGERLLQQVAPAIDTLNTALEETESARDRPSGLLRINMPRAAWLLIAPRLPGFLERYPDVQVELFADDGLSDMIAGGFDAGIRLGECLGKDMIALPITPPLKMVVAASPEYFHRHPQPQVPEDLAHHVCVHFRYSGSGKLVEWEFQRDGHVFEVAVGSRLIVNDGGTARDAALRGMGLVQLFEFAIGEDEAAGRLVRVLEPYYQPFPGFYIYYSTRRQLPPKLRAFVDFLREPMLS